MGRTEVCQLIIKLVGGQDNINKVWHCMTRLRFDLIDDSKVEWQKIKQLPGVLGAQNQSDQVQIIIGPQVNAWYQDIVDNMSPEENAPSTTAAAIKPKARKSLISLFMDTVSGVFGPIVPAIAGAGMIKGLLAGLIALKII